MSVDDKLQTLGTMLRRAKEVEKLRIELIQTQAEEIDHLQKELAMAEIRIEELGSELAEERQGRDG